MFVLPSHTEGFGMPALEAMTVGVPVVAANRGALPKWSGDAGRCSSRTMPALAAALDELLTDATAARPDARRRAWLAPSSSRWARHRAAVREAWTQSRSQRRDTRRG